MTQTTHVRRYLNFPLDSISDAKSACSFIVHVPNVTRFGLSVAVINHHWPEWVSRTTDDPHSDFVEIRYSSPDGKDLEVLNGFISRYIGVHQYVSDDVKGRFAVGEKEGYWMSVGAHGSKVVDGRYVPAEWRPGFAAVAWELAEDDESRIYFSMSSHTLSVADLQELAITVQPA